MGEDVRSALHDELAHHRNIVALQESERRMADTQRQLADVQAAKKKAESDTAAGPDWSTMTGPDFEAALQQKGWA